MPRFRKHPKPKRSIGFGSPKTGAKGSNMPRFKKTQSQKGK